MTFERDNIQAMSGYVSGEQPENDDTIKLNTNENPYPPSPAIDEVIAGVKGADLRRYPPPTANGFRDLAAERHGLARENIIATRGGDELLRLVITTFVDPGATIAMTDPTYSLYPVLAQIHDCKVHKVPLQADWSLDPDFITEVRSAQLVLVVNPHAPSGRLLDLQTLKQIAASIEGVLLIDEAYVNFVDPALNHDASPLVREFDNVVVLRSMSKGYSLAGLRFGYGIASPTLVTPMLEKTRDSYNLDYLSQKIAEAALADHDHARSTWEKVRTERTRLARDLAVLGFAVAPSQSNFLLATAAPPRVDAGPIYEALKARGILVRYFKEPRLLDKLRITVGTHEENDRLIDALASMV